MAIMLNTLIQRLEEIKRKNPEAAYAQVYMKQYETACGGLEALDTIDTMGEKITEIHLG
jgi:hypothetical protein